MLKHAFGSTARPWRAAHQSELRVEEGIFLFGSFLHPHQKPHPSQTLTNSPACIVICLKNNDFETEQDSEQGDFLTFHLLIVDDDELVGEALELIIKEPWQLHRATSLKEIPKNQVFHAAFVDMHLTDMHFTDNTHQAEGLKVLDYLRKYNPHAELIAISGDLNRSLMEDGLKNGASKFLAKPLGREEVLLNLEKIEAHVLLQNVLAQKSLYTKTSPPLWIGSEKNTKKIRSQIAQLKGENKPILIYGETGTGKEVVSQILGTQADGPFIQVNVASLPETLFESEIFGHVKGAFTGATQNKIGLAEAAHNGTLLLDEIEALPPHLQVKLLRFMESGEVKKVGSSQTINVCVRIIAATNEDLEKKVQDGEFRQDLLWRLNGHHIHLPPLRERKEDIEELTRYFLEKERPQRNKTFTPEGIEALKQHNWPGNVRELRRVCEQLSLHSPLPFIRVEDVEMILTPSKTISDWTLPEKVDFSQGLSQLVNQYEAKLIELAVEQNKEIDYLTKKLQISRSSLYKKLKDYRIGKEYGIGGKK